MSPHRRITFMTNFLTPYRVTFYEKLYSYKKYNWLLLHGIKKKEDGRPAYLGKLSFPNQSVDNLEGKVGTFDVRWQTGVLRSLRLRQPQMVITLGIPSMLTNWLAMAWAKYNGMKTITWYCGWESQEGNTRSLVIKQWLLRRYMRLADHILVYSSKAAVYLKTLGIQPEKITVCYNGLEIDHLLGKEAEYEARGQDLRKQCQIGKKKIFLYVGGIMTAKQIPLLLDAFQSIDRSEKAVLWLVGDGPDLNAIKLMVENMNLKEVKFWGRVLEDVDVFFAAADYFVLPGVGGLALNQALFWGLPCIVSEADGTEDDLVLDGKTGFRFISKDARSLRNVLLKCLELPEANRLAFGSSGRKLILERSNVNQMVNTFIETIDHLTAS